MTGPQSTSPAPAALDELGQGAPAVAGAKLESLLDMMLPVAIEFGRTTMAVQEVLDLGPGSVIQLDRMVGEPVDIYVSDRRLAEGEVVVVGEHFGVRITRVLSLPRDPAPKTGGR
jgi:flagellar motor switch protein FliN/FliY